MSPTIRQPHDYKPNDESMRTMSPARILPSLANNRARYTTTTTTNLLTAALNNGPTNDVKYNNPALGKEQQPFRYNGTILKHHQNDVKTNHVITSLSLPSTTSGTKPFTSFSIPQNNPKPIDLQNVGTQGINLNVKNAETAKMLNFNGVKKEHLLQTASISEAETLNGRVDNFKKRKHKLPLLEKCLYSHKMFIGAAKIFEFLMQQGSGQDDEKGGLARNGNGNAGGGEIPEISFDSPQEQMKTFELAFSTLKFQRLFRGILEQTGFFNDYPSLIDKYSLVAVILFDIQSRKFQKRKTFPNEQLDDLCLEIEDSILSKKTRLQSNVAKERIKHSAASIDFLIPEQVRSKDETKSKTPVYLWVNQMKTTIEEIISELEAENFTRLDADEDISEQTGRVFQIDAHCSDLIMFPPHLDMYFKDTAWVKAGHLVQQDKSSCLAPQSAHLLVGTDQDLIHVNVSTGVTTAHLASLLKEKSPHSHIFGFGLDTPDKVKKAVKNLEFLGAKNTKILTENFLNIDPDEPKLRGVRVILFSANCSKSAIASPVQFIVSEGEDMRFLGELSKDDQGLSSVGTLMVEHEKILRHALRFPRVQAVVYVTRSKHEAENEVVVNRVLEYANASNIRGPPFTVSPPVLPFKSEQINSGSGGVDDKYIRFLPSDKSNGCFVAIISREPDDPKEVARNTIARARSGGILGKGRSAPQTITTTTERAKSSGNHVTSSSAGPKRNRKLNGSATTVHPVHRRSTAIGVRLYKAGMAQIRERDERYSALKPEHLKIVKHPAPFR